MNDKGTTWYSELEARIQTKYKIAEFFSIDNVYEWEDHFGRLYPSNNNVRQKLRQTVQWLRDDGLIEFVDYRGCYRRLR